MDPGFANPIFGQRIDPIRLDYGSVSPSLLGNNPGVVLWWNKLDVETGGIDFLVTSASADSTGIDIEINIDDFNVYDKLTMAVIVFVEDTSKRIFV